MYQYNKTKLITENKQVDFTQKSITN